MKEVLNAAQDDQQGDKDEFKCLGVFLCYSLVEIKNDDYPKQKPKCCFIAFIGNHFGKNTACNSRIIGSLLQGMLLVVVSVQIGKISGFLSRTGDVWSC